MKSSAKRKDKASLSGGSSSNSFDANEACEKLLRHFVSEMGALAGSVFLVDTDSGRLRLVNAIGPRRNRHIGETLGVGEGVSGYVAASKEPLVISDISKKKDLTRRKRFNNIESFMSFPLMMNAEVLGVINLSGRENGNPFTKRDLRKTQGLLDECGDLLTRMSDSRARAAERELAAQTETGQARLEDIERELQRIGIYNEYILRSLSECIVVFDERFTISYCSKDEQLLRLLGARTWAETASRSLLELPLGIERAVLKQKLEEMMKEGAPFSLNNVKIGGAQESFVVNMFFAPFSSSEDSLSRGLLILDDNTKSAELQQRLTEAEKLSFIGSLTSTITHEVNGPLDGVIRLVNLSLARLDEAHPAREYLTEAQKGLRRIASLVGSLLAFSRKSSSLDADFTLLNKIIDHAVRMAQNRDPGKNVCFQLNLDSFSPNVSTNDFYQAVSNLLSNSLDAVAPDTGTVKVETRIDEKNLHIVVEDNGHGIPEHLRPQVFNAFFTTKEYGCGTGLGLSIVKKIVEKYDGDVRMNSEQNAGTRIQLSFPLDKVRAPIFE